MKTRRHCPRHCARPGWTLVEMLMVISLTGTLALLGTKVLILFLQLDVSNGAQAAAQLARERLELQFRRDVHHAMQAQIVPGATGLPQLTLTMPNAGQVTYTPDLDGCRRAARQGGTLSSDDVFLLGPVALAFESAPPLLELRIRPAADISSSVLTACPATLRIAPVLGADWRHVSGRPAGAGGEP